MQSTYIKAEPNLSDVLENKQNTNNDILSMNSNIVFQIKMEPMVDGLTISESFIDNSQRCISIIKEEVDISDNKESDEKIIYDDNLEKNQKYNYCETEYTNVKWPSKYKSIDQELKPNSTSGNNVIIHKDLRVSLERISKSEISRYKKADNPENIDQNDDVNKTWSSFCKLHCFRCNKTIDAKPTFKTTKCRDCKIAMFLQCKKCEKLCNRPITMYHHLRSRCYPRKKYNCAHCNFETTIRSSILLHIKCLHNENNQSIECPKCRKTLKHNHAFRMHQKRCKMEGRFSCTICPYKSHFSESFKSHMASHEKFKKLIQDSRSKANYESMIDDINSESITDLRKCEILNNFERFCPQCNTTFENNRFGNKRISNFIYECHMCKTRVLLQCRKCNIRLHDVKNMKQHLLKKCALKINYKCPECDLETVHKRNLKNHIKRFHTIINLKELKKCPKCDKFFKLTSHIKSHLKTCGNGLYNYHCDHCAFRTKNKKNMRFHAQKHINIDPVKV